VSSAISDDYPLGWALTTLGKPFTWGSGGTPLRSRADYYGGDVPWAIIGDLSDGPISKTSSFITELGLRESAAKPVPPGSVLLAMYGSIGKLGINSIPLTTNQAIAFTHPAPIDAKYLFYYLMSARPELISRGKGGTQSNISQTVIKAFPFVVAPQPEQHRIVEAIESCFTRLDDAVATLKRAQRNLKRYRASVLKAAVEGRLVPTEAELARDEGRDYEPASVLLDRILAERRRRWEEAELAKMTAKGKTPKDDKWKAKYKEPVAPDTADLPALPTGWCWATWSQVGFSQNGRAFPSKEYGGHGVRLLRPGNMHVSGRVEWNHNNTRCMPASWQREFPGFIVGPGELVMNLTAQSLKDEFLGRVCMTGVAEHCLLNQRIARLAPVVLRPTFVLWWLKTPMFRTFVDRLNKGSLIQHMFTSQLDNFTFPLPPLAEQHRIVAGIERLFGTAEAIDGDIQRIEMRVPRLRQSVLRWAFEGRLVDQDPTDEPASALLERIRDEREAAVPGNDSTRPRRRRATTG
jgi:type I restriction enzyme S subunit